LGRRFLDVLVADALYLQTPFVRAIEALGLEWVINLKDNQPELLRESQRLSEREADEEQSDQREQLRLWHLPAVDWPAADRAVRVVKTIRAQQLRRVVVREQDGARVKTKEPAVVEGANYYATSLELGSIPPRFIHQLGRSRWTIDAQAFQTITTECHLKQPSAHRDRSLLALTMIRVLAYTLAMVFYHRQVRSHCRGPAPTFCWMARELAYEFLAPRLDSS
jgi:hypothetical protein